MFSIKKLFEKKGPSKESKEGKNKTIIHTKCGKKIYYSDEDIRYGDLQLLSSSESIQRAYIDCPHCKEQLTFSFND